MEPCCCQVEQPGLVKESSALSQSRLRVPPRTIVPSGASLSCLGSFSDVTADKLSSLIFIPSQSIFLRPFAPAVITRLRSVRSVLLSSRLACATMDALTPATVRFFGRSSRHERRSLPRKAGLPCLSLISSTSHSATNHPTSPSSCPFPCSVSPAGSVLDGLGFAHSQESRQLASAESCLLALRTGCLALGCSRPRLAASPLLCASCSFTV
jgi:hypothetical protein